MKRTVKKQRRTYVTDMTQGNPARLLLAFALPLFTGNVVQQA